MPRPFVVGLSGGIASGKSSIAALLAAELAPAGGAALDCDKLGHRAYDPADGPAGVATRDALERAFSADAKGGTLLKEDGTVDRTKLGPIVFAAKEKMDDLNAIVWPAIAALAELELGKLGDEGVKIVIMEAAVLFEAGWETWVDEVWIVSCPPDVQRRRLCQRDTRLTAADADKRLASQMSIDDRLAKAAACRAHTVVIENSGSLTEATERSAAACSALLRRMADGGGGGAGARGCSWPVLLGAAAATVAVGALVAKR